MAYSDLVRRRLRLAAVALAGVGIAAFGYGLAATSGVSVPEPVLLSASGDVTVPHSPSFGGSLTLYGDPRESSTEPTLAGLGCRVTVPGRAAVLQALPESGRARRVIDSVALLPLADLDPSAGGGRISCSGSDATVSRPLYVVAAAGDAAMVPMASYSVAVLALALGLAGVASLRPRDNP